MTDFTPADAARQYLLAAAWHLKSLTDLAESAAAALDAWQQDEAAAAPATVKQRLTVAPQPSAWPWPDDRPEGLP